LLVKIKKTKETGRTVKFFPPLHFSIRTQAVSIPQLTTSESELISEIITDICRVSQGVPSTFVVNLSEQFIADSVPELFDGLGEGIENKLRRRMWEPGEISIYQIVIKAHPRDLSSYNLYLQFSPGKEDATTAQEAVNTRNQKIWSEWKSALSIRDQDVINSLDYIYGSLGAGVALFKVTPTGATASSLDITDDTVNLLKRQQ